MRDLAKEQQAWIARTWEKTEEKLRTVAVKSRDKIPYTTVNGVHTDKKEDDINWWTNGFWGGMMWLLYSETKNEVYKASALRSQELLCEAMHNYTHLHHDVGFMFHLTYGADYRLTGSQDARVKNLYAAATLASRYNVDGGFIRAWNQPGQEGWSIIDCMMNLPLLYWASEETGWDSFARIAMHHADMAVRDHVRADGSIYHIVEHDVNTGAFVTAHRGQGYSQDSCWTRGLAWAVYGMAISYAHTGKQAYLDAGVKTASYFIANVMADDYKTVVDFKAPPQPVYYDSTAGVCAACGMLELAKHLSPAEGLAMQNAAVCILQATDAHFCDYSRQEDALVLMGTERYPADERQMDVVHLPIIYGDFFFVEALLKLRGNDFFIW